MKRCHSQPLKLTAAIAISFVAFSAQANDTLASANNSFHHDTSASYITDTDNSDNAYLFASYRYYFDAVSTDLGPWALNTFLAQSSNFGVNYLKSDLAETSSYQVDGTYVFESNWFIGANYQQINDDDDSFAWPYNYDESLYGLKLGYYFNESSQISIFYQNQSGSDSYQHTSGSGQNFQIGLLAANFDNQSDTFGIETQSYIPMESINGVNLFARWQYTDASQYYYYRLAQDGFLPERYFTTDIDNTFNHIFLAADFYINKSWSIGAQYAWQDIDKKQFNSSSFTPEGETIELSDSVNNYGLNTAYWWQISANFSAKFSASKLLNDDGGAQDGLLLGIEMNARF
ncbi:putative porin [Shewanella japonica]|uniref:putative porin n=1 Tax=Shewanella japonica TaxID=93973 RepID=UPI002495A564|nr:putative porin [Shewanella japonica]